MNSNNMVMLVRRYDVEVVDEQTLEWECDCGAVLNLPHLQDMDTYRLWYGGVCMRCGRELDVESDDDEIHCRTCQTPLQFVSESDYEDEMYCPKCHPEEPAEIEAFRRDELNWPTVPPAHVPTMGRSEP